MSSLILRGGPGLRILLTENAIATADFSGTPLSGDAPLTVNFTDLSTGSPASWDWDFGDGSSHSTEQYPTHIYTVAGVYTVILSINGGASTKTQTDYITVNLVADLSGTPTTGKVLLTVNFTDLSTGVPTSWDWNFGDGSSHSTIKNPQHIYSTAGTYTVILTASKGVISSIVTKTNYVTARIRSGFSGLPVIGQLPLIAQFTDESLGGGITSWAWDFGDDTSVIRSQSPRHYYMRPGSYTVSLTVSNGVESDIETKTGYITVSPYTLSFSGTPRTGNPPIAVQFIDTSTGITPDEKLWEFGDGDTSTEQNPVHVYRRSQVYSVKMTVRKNL